MPSLMIHLLTAYKYNPDATVDFWLGNIAPDSVGRREEKDITHFRDRSDRLAALQNLASEIDLQDEFSKGILLHLFLDYYWDSYSLRTYIQNYKGDNWFPAYRHEIALAGIWLYHHKEWSGKIWKEMMECPNMVCGNVHEIVKGDISDFVIRNGMWHTENNIGPSEVFTPDYVETFTDKVSDGFARWLEERDPEIKGIDRLKINI